MKWVVLLFCLMTNLAFAQLDSREEVSINTASYGELRGEEIKKALLFQATTNAIEKFSADLGFDFNKYQEKLNSNFQEYFEQKLENREDSKPLSAQEAYKERQFEYFNYSKHVDLLRSYSFISTKRNPENPSQWNALIQLSLDQVKLQRLMRRTLQADNTKFSKMWLIVESNIHSFKWTDIGLEWESSFSNALAGAWKDWWAKNLPGNFDEVEICHQECLSYLHDWQSNGRNKAFNPDYSDGIWVNISYDIFRDANSTAQYPGFSWEGRVVLTDINTKKVLGSLSNKGKSRNLRGGDLQRLNSNLATQIFSSSAQKFTQMRSFIEQIVKINQVGQLEVKGHHHLGDVIALKDLIKTRGSNMGLEIELDHFSRDSATLLYFYQGEEKAFQDLLNRINELKSSKVYELKTHFSSKGPVVELKSVEVET
ncbi:MAG TPA: hypothetical protein VKY27_00225 [Bacteriovoracaceae bacterium]|nr:hypothetical protein [Bacteriovoracaceae bacterium]